MKRFNVGKIEYPERCTTAQAIRINELNKNGTEAQRLMYGREILTKRPEGMSFEQYKEIRRKERDLLRSVTR
jgi:hypothetical protein